MAKNLSKDAVKAICDMAEVHMTYYQACIKEGASMQQALVLTGHYMRALCESAAKEGKNEDEREKKPSTSKKGATTRKEATTKKKAASPGSRSKK